MIKLFITDLDGCVTDPFVTPNWDVFSQLRQLNLNSVEDAEIPPLSICTGRPMPYAEAMAQILGIQLPFLFESGGGMYQFEGNKLSWTPALTEERKKEVKEIKSWAKEHITSKFPLTIPEFAKFTDIGIINPDASIVEDIRLASEEFISANYEHFEVHHTHVS